MDLKKITRVFDITAPNKMGNNLLILATSPDVKAFFEDDKVRDHFKDYDVAFINKMPLCSEDELHVIKPRYIIFMDGIFFEDYFESDEPNERKIWVEKVLAGIDWECNIVIPSLARFGVDNDHLKYIRLSVMEARYNAFSKVLYRKNLANVGFNNVVMGAIYYGITFGYTNIAMMGFSYQNGKKYMDVDGMHLEGYPHYYDLDTHPRVIPFEQLFDGKNSYTLKRALREAEAEKKLLELAIYAKDMGVRVTNYTPMNGVSVFPTGRLPQ